MQSRVGERYAKSCTAYAICIISQPDEFVRLHIAYFFNNGFMVSGQQKNSAI
jgi:hypothetical protein